MVVDAKSPITGLTCIKCDRSARSGDSVYVVRDKCLPLEGLGTKLDHVYCLHKRCLIGMIQESPDDAYDDIRNRLVAGGPLFNER